MTDSRRRRRRILLVLLLGGAAGVALRARRAAPAPADPWPVRPPAAAEPAPAPQRAPAPGPVATPEPAPGSATVAADEPVAAPAAAVAEAPQDTPTPQDTSAAAASADPPADPRYGPGSAAALPDGSSPGPEFTIKGNASSMLFHPPSSPYYGRTKAEVWFRTAEDATAAGFTAWTPRRRRSTAG